MSTVNKRDGGHARREDTQECETEVKQEQEWASLQELGARWHMNGVRVWNWAHNGTHYNGWIGFLAGGHLSHSFKSGKGEWKLVDEGTMIVTFGSCNHRLSLSAKAAASKNPYFQVTERTRRDGEPLSNPVDPGTCGYPAQPGTCGYPAQRKVIDAATRSALNV
jgi:hypothetical protein